MCRISKLLYLLLTHRRGDISLRSRAGITSDKPRKDERRTARKCDRTKKKAQGA